MWGLPTAQPTEEQTIQVYGRGALADPNTAVSSCSGSSTTGNGGPWLPTGHSCPWWPSGVQNIQLGTPVANRELGCAGPAPGGSRGPRTHSFPLLLLNV